MPAIYAAASRALAALELLVHLESADLLATYVLFEIAIPSNGLRSWTGFR